MCHLIIVLCLALACFSSVTAAQPANESEAQEQAVREQEEALKKRAAELQKQIEEALKRPPTQPAAADPKVVDEYKRRIADKIKRFIVEPPNLQGNPEVEMDIVLLPGGEVLGVKTRRASNMSAWDNAVERAIMKANPLPVPPDHATFTHFRRLQIRFRPRE